MLWALECRVKGLRILSKPLGSRVSYGQEPLMLRTDGPENTTPSRSKASLVVMVFVHDVLMKRHRTWADSCHRASGTFRFPFAKGNGDGKTVCALGNCPETLGNLNPAKLLNQRCTTLQSSRRRRALSQLHWFTSRTAA